MDFQTFKKRYTTSAAVMALSVAVAVSVTGLSAGFSLSTATAAEDGHSGGSGGSGGHSGGSGGSGGHDDGGHDDGGDDHSSGSKGPHYQGGRGGVTGSTSRGRGGRSLEDRVFHSAEPGEDSDRRGPQFGGGGSTGKPDNAGSQRGSLFGDMYVILRDANGVPILTPEGFRQPLDAAGNPIPLDDEGHPIDESLTVEVELGRLNVSRAPTRVLDKRMEEVVSVLNSATAVTQDAAGRLVLTVDGEEKTIDSPLENLAIYRALVTGGTLEGVTLDPSILGSLAHLTDGAKTADDMSAAAAFLAGAADKTSPLSVDKIVYLNSILGIEGDLTGGDGQAYVDYGGFTYDRLAAFGGTTATVLIQQPDGTWTTQIIDIMNAVFGDANVSPAAGIGAYSQSTDDARAVINFIHEYEEPAHETH
jgi:hypothetical protein